MRHKFPLGPHRCGVLTPYPFDGTPKEARVIKIVFRKAVVAKQVSLRAESFSKLNDPLPKFGIRNAGNDTQAAILAAPSMAVNIGSKMESAR
jgi:hypothetical protein